MGKDYLQLTTQSFLKCKNMECQRETGKAIKQELGLLLPQCPAGLSAETDSNTSTLLSNLLKMTYSTTGTYCMWWMPVTQHQHFQIDKNCPFCQRNRFQGPKIWRVQNICRNLYQMEVFAARQRCKCWVDALFSFIYFVNLSSLHHKLHGSHVGPGTCAHVCYLFRWQ